MVLKSIQKATVKNEINVNKKHKTTNSSSSNNKNYSNDEQSETTNKVANDKINEKSTVSCTVYTIRTVSKSIERKQLKQIRIPFRTQQLHLDRLLFLWRKIFHVLLSVRHCSK